MTEPRVTRRAAVLAGTTAALGAGTVAGSAGASGSSLRAVAAARFHDAVGVQTHLSYNDTSYVHLDQVADALADLGVTHIRDDLVLGRPDLYAALNRLAGLGIGADLITGRPGDAGAAAYAAVIAQQLARVDSVEGPNEWDILGGPGWAPAAYQRQRELMASMRSDPRTAGIPVLAPGLAYLANMPELAAVGPLGAVSDIANAHAYGGGQPMPGVVGGVRAVMKTSQPGQPVMITEAGYHNALNGARGHPAVTEAVAATYVPRIFLDAFTGGIARTYLYELLDERPDPGRSDNEANFGLLRHDFSPKPAYLSLRTLLRLAEDGDGSSGTRPLPVELRGPRDLRHLLLHKRNGTHLLALWRSVSIYKRRHPVDVRPATVRVGLRGAPPVRVYRPATGSVAVTLPRGSGVALPLGGEVVVLVIGGLSTDFARPIAPDPPTGVRARRTAGGVRVTWRRPAYRTAATWQVRVGSRAVSVPGDQHSVLVRAGGADVRVRGLVRGASSAYVEATA